MPFKPGQSGNANGRPKGSKNKPTQFKEFVKQLLFDNYDQIKEDIKELEPKDRVMLLSKLAAFAEPTLRSVESKTEVINITQEEAREIIDSMAS